jgi:hypothetical protein
MVPDPLLLAERAHLVRLIVWALTCVVAGTAVVAVLAVRRTRSPLLSGFAIQTMAWGVLEAAIALVALARLAPRDLVAIMQLDRHLWLESGLDVGCIAAGATLALTTLGLAHGKRLGGVGAGLGIIVQGAVLLALDVRFVMFVNAYV